MNWKQRSWKWSANLRPELSSTAALARRRVEQLRLTHARLSGVRESAIARDKELTVKVGHAKGRLALDEKVQATLEALQNRAHQRAVGAFEGLLSAILADVLPDKGAVKLELGTERGAPALDVQIDNGGAREDALNGSGGAVTNVLSAGLRFAALSRTGNRKFMVLDEPDCWLKPDRVPALMRVLAEVAEKARTQTVLISHHEPSNFEGCVNIVRLTKDTNGVVRTEVMEPRNGVMWLDEDEPGIRSIRLINFRAHVDTTLPLFPGVTALIGDNDLGKSTLAVSALRAVAYGEADDTLIRHGASEARVEIRLEGGRVIEWVRRAKGSPKVTYALHTPGKPSREGKPSRRGEVPEWITEALGILRVDNLDIQIGSQKAPVFLLDESASTRAQLLSVGRESGRLHALIDSYADLKRKDNATVREGEAEIAKLRARIEASASVPEMLEKLEALTSEAVEVESFTARQMQLAKFLARVQSLELRHAAALARARALESLPQFPVLHSTQRIEQLIRVIERAGRIATLRREFPTVSVPVLAELAPLARITATIERAREIAGKGRPLPQISVPALEDTARLAQVASVIERTAKIAGLRRSFPAVELPSLKDNQSLVLLGQRIGRLAKRAALAEELPSLPEKVDVANLSGMARQIERLAVRAEAQTKLKQDVVTAKNAEDQAREDLNGLIEAMGGVCPVCDGELREVSDDNSHTHAHG